MFDAAKARRLMVEGQIRTADVTDAAHERTDFEQLRLDFFASSFVAREHDEQFPLLDGKRASEYGAVKQCRAGFRDAGRKLSNLRGRNRTELDPDFSGTKSCKNAVRARSRCFQRIVVGDDAHEDVARLCKSTRRIGPLHSICEIRLRFGSRAIVSERFCISEQQTFHHAAAHLAEAGYPDFNMHLR